MSKPLPLQNQFARMVRDVSRNRLPPNTAWDLRDLIPDYGAPARERSGWAHASNSITAVTATASYVQGGLFAIFSPTGGADPQNLAVDEDGVLYKIATAGTVTQVGASRQIIQNPAFHGAAAVSAATPVFTGLVIIPDGTGVAVPKKYDGTNLSDLNGTPPKAKLATVYRDFTVLGHGTVGSTYYPNRIWFSPPGDPDCAVEATAWDTTDSWIDFSLPVLGLGATKNVLLIFHDGQMTRIRGSTPPPDEDMLVDDPWQKIGLLDPFSITEHQDMVFWCAPEGVFRTDGVTVDDITLKGGMLRYWLDLVSMATSTWTFAAGIVRNRLFITVMDGTTIKDAFLVDLATYGWTRLTNMDAVSFWSGLRNEADELYFGRRNQAFVGRCQTMFEVDDSAFKNDGNGTAVASVLETPYYELGRPGIKTVKSLFAGFFLKDYATDNPTIAVSYVDTPEATSYTALGTLSENTKYDRRRIQIGGRHWGVAFKFARSNAGDFHGYDLSAEVIHQEESKRIS